MFSESGLNELSLYFTKNTLYAFDFDGTITSLKHGYSFVKIKPSLRKKLRLLAALVPVVVVSGRGKRSLEKTLSEPAIRVVGDHGIEGAHKLSMKRRKEFKSKMNLLKDFIATHFINNEKMKGLFIEDKKISLTLHFYNSSCPERNRQKVIKALEKMKSPPRLILGRGVLNCLPTFKLNKGTSILHLRKVLKCSHAIYLGDDGTDEDVFRLKDKKILKVRIGKTRTTSATHYLWDQSEVEVLISRILEFLMPGHLNSL